MMSRIAPRATWKTATKRAGEPSQVERPHKMAAPFWAGNISDVVVNATECLETIDEEEEDLGEYVNSEETDNFYEDTEQIDEELYRELEAKGVGEELEALKKFDVYEVVPAEEIQRKPGKTISTRWLKVLKQGEQGELRVKARFVAREFKAWNKLGSNVFAPTSMPTTHRIIDMIAAKKGWKTMIGDTTNAFLHVPIEDTVYVNPPEEWMREHISKCGWITWPSWHDSSDAKDAPAALGFSGKEKLYSKCIWTTFTAQDRTGNFRKFSKVLRET